jgi:hypothetical protein
LNGGPETLEKWLVDVKCDGCKGLFYRSAPNVIVPDADWPRNGDVVAGYAIPNIPGASELALCVFMVLFIILCDAEFASYPII